MKHDADGLRNRNVVNIHTFPTLLYEQCSKQPRMKKKTAVQLSLYSENVSSANVNYRTCSDFPFWKTSEQVLSPVCKIQSGLLSIHWRPLVYHDSKECIKRRDLLFLYGYLQPLCRSHDNRSWSSIAMWLVGEKPTTDEATFKLRGFLNKCYQQERFPDWSSFCSFSFISWFPIIYTCSCVCMTRHSAFQPIAWILPKEGEILTTLKFWSLVRSLVDG